MPRMTRETALAARAAKDTTEEIEVPEWGGTLTVRALTLEERHKARENATENPETGEMNLPMFEALVLITGIADPQFTIADLEWIKSQPSGVVDRVLKVIYRLSGIGPAAVTEKKDALPETTTAGRS